MKKNWRLRALRLFSAMLNKSKKICVRAINFFLLPLLLAGCVTTATYKSVSPAGPSKPAGYPIPVYMENADVPRPVEVIGTVSVHNSGFTVAGGSVDSVMKLVMSRAREKGADAVRVADIDKPDFRNPNYRVTADLLRFTDSWETVAISEKQFLAYLQKNPRPLDPIEAVGAENGNT